MYDGGYLEELSQMLQTRFVRVWLYGAYCAMHTSKTSNMRQMAAPRFKTIYLHPNKSLNSFRDQNRRGRTGKWQNVRKSRTLLPLGSDVTFHWTWSLPWSLPLFSVGPV